MVEEWDRAYIFTGYPGSGKSTAARIGADIMHGDTINAGDMIRELAADEGLGNPTSEELGDFAAELRKERGNGFFGEITVGRMLRGELEPSFPVFIDSCRHVDGINEFKEYFDSTKVFWVDAPRAMRLDRLQQRGRDGEDDFTMAELLQRDNHELENLGVKTIMQNTDIIDSVIKNDKSLTELEQQVASRLYIDE